MASTSGPTDLPTVTPYLVVRSADELVTYLQRAYGAETRLRLTRTDGSVMHVEVALGESIVMIGEPMEGFDPVTSHLFLRVDSANDAHRRAIEAGGTEFMPPTTMKHAGERYGAVVDPAGNTWWASERLEDLSQAEQQRRINAMRL